MFRVRFFHILKANSPCPVPQGLHIDTNPRRIARGERDEPKGASHAGPPENALIRLALGACGEHPEPILYRATNALIDFESPSFSRPGADFARAARYVHACAPDATTADESGRATAHDGATKGDQTDHQPTNHHRTLQLRRTVTWRCHWRRDPGGSRQLLKEAPARKLAHSEHLSRPPGFPSSSGQYAERTLPRPSRRLQIRPSRQTGTWVPRRRADRPGGSISSWRGRPWNRRHHSWPARDLRLTCQSPAPRSPFCAPISARR
jgi:hypothetical protein